MIQKEGIIKSPAEKEQIAIEHLLFEKGFINANRRVTTSGPDFSWCDDKSFGNVDGMFGSSVSGFADLKEHTLADFDLLPGGEPMLTMDDIEVGGSYLVREDLVIGTFYGLCEWWGRTDKLRGEVVTVKDKLSSTQYGSGNKFDTIQVEEVREFLTPQMLQRRVDAPTFGHLKAGDPNPFVVGMEVIYGSDHRAIVRRLLNGPSVELEWENKVTGTYGFFPDGGQRNRNVDINTIFPATQEQPVPHEYKFGDKVKTHRHEPKPRYYIGSVANVTYTSDIDPASFFDFAVQGTHSGNISPWPEPVTISLNCEYTATLDQDGARVGCQTISPEAMDELTAEWLKIRGNE